MFSRLIGNATKMNNKDATKDLKNILIDGEVIELAFRVVRDMIVFTNLRALFCDVAGVTGRKKIYHSIPYRSIGHFSIETAGSFERDIDLKLWVRGLDEPIESELKKGGKTVLEIQRILLKYM
ncbi:MAG: PH domain-containing protein [Candidatus Heimdallarchaeota archaeon]|nr:PH domain-containing protein [Candidatus Heimdallarchaeota archaeon]MCK5048592.1 PH domain-containing protein [Candidatus Heimdallarchaeota archaeon]